MRKLPCIALVLLSALQWASASNAWSQELEKTEGSGSDSAARSAGGFPFTDAAHRNATLHAGLDSIWVRFGDGRSDLVARVVQRPEGAYLSLPDLGMISGGGFKWNPETWRGSLWVDSKEVLLFLDTQVFWVDGIPVQIPAPVRYDSEQVLIPMGFLEGIFLPLMRERATWDPVKGRLAIHPTGAILQPITVTEGAGSATLVFQPVGGDALRVRWDPVGSLHVEIRGASLPLDFAPFQGLPEGLRLMRFHGIPSGAEFVFEVSAEWLGMMFEKGRGDAQSIRLTQRAQDIAGGQFAPLGSFMATRTEGMAAAAVGKTIVVEIPSEAELGVGRAYCLETLARTLQDALERDFGHKVILQRDRSEMGGFSSPAGAPEIPSCPAADCWIGFRLERWPGSAVREFLLITPSPAPQTILPGPVTDAEQSADGHARDYRDGVFLTGRILPWGQTARLHQGSSMRLARTLSEHMGHEWEGRPVRITSHPARMFRGLDMPAVVIGPGLAEEIEAMDQLCDSEAAQRLVRNMAFGIDEFLAASSQR